MKRTAILIDGAWFSNTYKDVAKALPTAAQVYSNAQSWIEQSKEEIFRIFYYDSLPYENSGINPIDKQNISFKDSPAYQCRMRFFKELGKMEYIALRRGTVRLKNWSLQEKYMQKVLAGTSSSPTGADIYPIFEQKGVDMRIGIDVSTLSLKKLVERIILVSNDTDMVPAMKLARREGVQVVLIKVGNRNLHDHLIEDADIVRSRKLIHASKSKNAPKKKTGK